jgi:hypothetical protein
MCASTTLGPHNLALPIIFITLSGVRLSALGTVATTGLLYQSQIDDGYCGAIGGMKIGRGNRSTRRKPAPAPHSPPQIPDSQTRARTRAAEVGMLFPLHENNIHSPSEVVTSWYLRWINKFFPWTPRLSNTAQALVNSQVRKWLPHFSLFVSGFRRLNMLKAWFNFHFRNTVR